MLVLSDQDVDRIAAAVVEKLTGQARQVIDIQREVGMSREERKALSRDRVASARKRSA